MQQIQRGGNKQINLFESFWYIIVTFSTVGYGGMAFSNIVFNFLGIKIFLLFFSDIYPDIWPSQLCMILLIIVVILVIPSQVK